MRSSIVTSQLPVEKRHAMSGDPSLADAILDRFVHSAYHLNLKGESMRKSHRPSVDPNRSLGFILQHPRRFAPISDRVDRNR